MLLYREWVEENVLEPAPHRQYVFTLPRLLRPRPLPRRPQPRVPGVHLLGVEAPLAVDALDRELGVVGLAARTAQEGLLGVRVRVDLDAAVELGRPLGAEEILGRHRGRRLSAEPLLADHAMRRSVARLARLLQIQKARQPPRHHFTTERRCAAEAGRVRLRDQSRSRAISSLMVAESGNVSSKASITCAWVSSVPAAKAW